MDSCDVLIVAEVPRDHLAPGDCALRDAHVILDKASFPRNKVCGGWITPWVLQALKIDAADYAPGRTMQEIRGFRVSSMGAREVGIPYERVISYGIRRCEFDEYLLRRSGAGIREGSPITRIE